MDARWHLRAGSHCEDFAGRVGDNLRVTGVEVVGTGARKVRSSDQLIAWCFGLWRRVIDSGGESEDEGDANPADEGRNELAGTGRRSDSHAMYISPTVKPMQAANGEPCDGQPRPDTKMVDPVMVEFLINDDDESGRLRMKHEHIG